MDYSSAFDTVDHSLLLLVLKNVFNINGSSLSWIKSYLSNRFVYVSLNHSTSIPATSTYGVPQGSILGTLLYVSFDQSSLNTAMTSISSCLTSIENWSSSMSLKLIHQSLN